MNVKHISLGELIRDQIDRDTWIGKESNKYVSSGSLVPDEIADSIVSLSCTSVLRNATYNGFILDGYPRSISQANKALELFSSPCVVNISLDKDIAIEKVISRRICSTCKSDFNLANICRDGFDMPSILPNPELCSLGSKSCVPNLIQRKDDEFHTILRRYEIFEKEISPILDFFNSKNILKTFRVTKGLQQANELVELIKHK